MNRKNIIKYLTHYAEQTIVELGSHLIRDLFSGQSAPLIFEHVVVIPAYKESTDFVERFLSSDLINQSVLCIVVVNQPDTDKNTLSQQHLYNTIKNKGSSIFVKGEIELISTDNKSYFLVVDAFSKPLPEDQGVGLARKLGADLALLLINDNIIKSQWIHSTDADAHLPNDYFKSTSHLNNQTQNKNTVAVSYNFTHVNDNADIFEANKLYETALRYYVAGLTYARSTYNFFTIGSVIAFKANEYAMVRGFPKRSAGEDFYLLNKLAKLGNVDFLQECVVTIDARVSDRVPFGTGPAVNHILQLTKDNKAYCYYHPQVFEELQTCIQHFFSLWEHRLKLNEWLDELSKEAQKALLDNKLDVFVQKQINNNQLQFNKQLNVWFDAFKTLKFIHSLREQKYHDIPLAQAIALANFTVALN